MEMVVRGKHQYFHFEWELYLNETEMFPLGKYTYLFMYVYIYIYVCLHRAVILLCSTICLKWKQVNILRSILPTMLISFSKKKKEKKEERKINILEKEIVISGNKI